MNFADAAKTGIREWVTFSGRASRSEYWWFMLALIILAILIGLTAAGVNQFSSEAWATIKYLYIVPILFLFMAATSAGVRRLHDLHLSGWWYGGYLIVDRISEKLSDKYWAFALVSLCAALALIYFFVKRGTVGSNKYGLDPLPPTLIQRSTTPNTAPG